MTSQALNLRPHFLSAFARSLFTNSSQIFITSVFVSALGGKSYSDLFFFASLFSILYYIYFALKGEKAAYRLYQGVLVFAFLSLLFFFFQPQNKPVLYYFAVSVVVVDLIGTNLGPIVLQASVNPSIFKEVFQKIVSLELVARIAAAALVWTLSKLNLNGLYYASAVITLFSHFVLFSSAIGRIKAPAAEVVGAAHRCPGESGTSLAGSDASSLLSSIRSSMEFISANPLTKIALSIMIWTHVTKFLVEYLFYQVTASHFQEAGQIASFVSALTVFTIVCSLLIQKLVGKHLAERLQLSTLFSFQPANILILGGLALALPPFWPIVVLMVVYQCINRSIQLPVSRQCLLPVPRSGRAGIASLFSLFMAIAAFLTSGLMSFMKGALNLHDFLFVLLILSGLIFFLITRMDAFYVRNLWSFYREGRSGVWTDQPFAEGLMTDDFAEDISEHALSLQPDLQNNKIFQTYLKSNDKEALKLAVMEHKALIAGDEKSRILGLNLAFVAGFPWFEKIYGGTITADGSMAAAGPLGAASHTPTQKNTPEYLSYQIREVQSQFNDMADYSSTFRRKIKQLAIVYFDSNVTAYQKLKGILSFADKRIAEALVSVLADKRFKEQQGILLDCIQPEEAGALFYRLRLAPLLTQMYNLKYSAAGQVRKALLSLDLGQDSSEMKETISQNLDQLSTDFSLEQFMHTLFLEEYCLSRHGLAGTLAESISEFAVLEAEEMALLVEMHVEYLKTSANLDSWVLLMKRAEAKRDYNAPPKIATERDR